MKRVSRRQGLRYGVSMLRESVLVLLTLPLVFYFLAVSDRLYGPAALFFVKLCFCLCPITGSLILVIAVKCMAGIVSLFVAVLAAVPLDMGF